MSDIEEVVNLKEISERFNNGTETIEDIMNYCRNYKITFENKLKLRVVQKKYFDKLVERIKELEQENEKYTIKLTDEEYRRVIENAQRDLKKQFEQKVKDLIKNETINISGFECISVEDLEELLEEK